MNDTRKKKPNEKEVTKTPLNSIVVNTDTASRNPLLLCVSQLVGWFSWSATSSSTCARMVPIFRWCLSSQATISSFKP